MKARQRCLKIASAGLLRALQRPPGPFVPLPVSSRLNWLPSLSPKAGRKLKIAHQPPASTWLLSAWFYYCYYLFIFTCPCCFPSAVERDIISYVCVRIEFFPLAGSTYAGAHTLPAAVDTDTLAIERWKARNHVESNRSKALSNVISCYCVSHVSCFSISIFCCVERIILWWLCVHQSPIATGSLYCVRQSQSVACVNVVFPLPVPFQVTKLWCQTKRRATHRVWWLYNSHRVKTWSAASTAIWEVRCKAWWSSFQCSLIRCVFPSRKGFCVIFLCYSWP